MALHLWIVPWTLPDAQVYSIAIHANDTPSEWGSCTPFNIYTNQTIVVTQPTIATQWENGTTQTISWTWNNGIINVDIDLYKNSIFNQSIVSNVANTGSYDWDIPDNLINGSDYSIRVIESVTRADYNFSSDFSMFMLPPLNNNTNNNNSGTPPDDPLPLDTIIIIGSVSGIGLVSLFFFQKKRKVRR